MSTARPSKPLVKAVRQYANELTASIRAVASDHLQHELEQQRHADRGVAFQYLVAEAPFDSAAGRLTLTAYQTIVPRTDERAGQFSISRYGYHLRTAEGGKLLRWDFDPTLPPSWPHLHLDAAGSAVAGKSLSVHHMPTGRVLLEDVLRYLIHDCGVSPSASYEDSLRISETWFDSARWGTARGHRDHSA